MNLFDMIECQSQNRNPILLRPYQEAAAAAVEAAWDSGVNRPLIVLATGTGKTTIFSELVRRNAGRSLVLAHRDELLEQALLRLRAQAGVACDKEAAAQRAAQDSRCVVASVQTLGNSNRLEWLSPELVIVDEAHHAAAATYQNVFRRFGIYDECSAVRLLGVTATPHRLDNKPLYGDASAIFQEVVHSFTIRDAVGEGWLCDLRGFRVASGIDLSGVKSREGDYVLADLQKRVDTPERNELAFEKWREVADGKRTMVFTASVANAHACAELWKARGVKAVAVDGKMPRAERDAAIAAFRSGSATVLCNMDIATEGFDVPEVEAIIMLRPTQSWALYTQVLGRGTRVLPGVIDGLPDAASRLAAIRASAKQACICIDIVDNSTRHSVCTVPAIMGLPTNVDLQGHTLSELAAAVEQLSEEEMALLAALDEGDGRGGTPLNGQRTIAFESLSTALQQVDLLAELETPVEAAQLTKLAWLKLGESYIVDCGDGRAGKISRDMLGRWVVQVGQHSKVCDVADGDLQTVFMYADRAIQRMWPDAITIAGADVRWKTQLPTERQLAALRALNVSEVVLGRMTRGQASHLLSRLNAGRVQEEPATPAQIAYMQRKGLAFPPNCTKRDAGVIIGRSKSAGKRR